MVVVRGSGTFFYARQPHPPKVSQWGSVVPAEPKNFSKFHRHPPTNSDQAAKTVENSKKVIFPTCSLGRCCWGPPSECTSPCREPSLEGGRARPGSLRSPQGTQSTPSGSPWVDCSPCSAPEAATPPPSSHHLRPTTTLTALLSLFLTSLYSHYPAKEGPAGHRRVKDRKSSSSTPGGSRTTTGGDGAVAHFQHHENHQLEKLLLPPYVTNTDNYKYIYIVILI